MENWTQALSTGPLLGIAAAAVLLLLVLIIRFRIHAFIALVLISLLTALATQTPVEFVVPTLLKGFGGTLAGVALLVALGAMLGRLLEVSGGAKALADALVNRFGDDRAPMALGIASLIFGFPIFFDAGLVVMLPVVFAVARRLKAPVLLYGLPVAGAFSVMHVLMPPHPGPVTAASEKFFNADLGLVTLLGLVVAIPTWYLAGYLFGVFMGRRFPLPVPELLSGGPQVPDDELPRRAPGAGTVVGLLLLPLVLIFFNTGLNYLGTTGAVDPAAGWVRTLRMLGETPVALLITVLVASLVLGSRYIATPGSTDRTVMEKTLEPRSAR